MSCLLWALKNKQKKIPACSYCTSRSEILMYVSPCDHNQVLCVLKSILFFKKKIHTIGGGIFSISCDLTVVIPTPKTQLALSKKKLHMKSSIGAVLEFCLLNNVVCVCRRWWMYWCNVAQGQGWLSSYWDATLHLSFLQIIYLLWLAAFYFHGFESWRLPIYFFFRKGLTSFLPLSCSWDVALYHFDI